MNWILLLLCFALHASPFQCHIRSLTKIDTGDQIYNVYITNQYTNHQLVGRTNQPLYIQFSEEVDPSGIITHQYHLEHLETKETFSFSEDMIFIDCDVEEVQQTHPDHVEAKQPSNLQTHYIISRPHKPLSSSKQRSSTSQDKSSSSMRLFYGLPTYYI